jgi:hypothetical protein
VLLLLLATACCCGRFACFWASEMRVRCKWDASEMRVRCKWDASELGVRSAWDAREMQVSCEWVKPRKNYFNDSRKNFGKILVPAGRVQGKDHVNKGHGHEQSVI